MYLLYSQKFSDTPARAVVSSMSVPAQIEPAGAPGMTLSPRLEAYLRRWFTTSTDKKRKAGIHVGLTWEQFVSLFAPEQLRKLQSAIEADRLRYDQAAENPRALVLTWRSYEAVSSGKFTADTATICTRERSEQINRVRAGGKLRPGHAANIRQKLLGKPKTDEHKAAISASSKGQPKAPWTRERKLDRQAHCAFKRDQGVRSLKAPRSPL
jgi:hypothetical protein